jgi:geranylgeranyl pyrophosphate synthase
LTTPTLPASLTALAQRCDAQLLQLLGPAQSEFASGAANIDTLHEACAYSLSNGDKRVRPMLVYGAALSCGAELDESLDYAAAAIEMLHSYSLVHDDLPAMDNDDWRRGKPTCHVVYGEAVAILAGDALQSRAFELLSTAPDISDALRLQLVQTLAAAAGLRGMAGGQLIDMEATAQNIALAQLQNLHALKTGALIRAAVAMGAICAGASPTQQQALQRFAEAVGLAFQVQDDILDVAGESAALGKTAGKDQATGKSTYVSLLGLDGARAEARRLADTALAQLDQFGESADALRALANYIVTRIR